MPTNRTARMRRSRRLSPETVELARWRELIERGADRDENDHVTDEFHSVWQRLYLLLGWRPWWPDIFDDDAELTDRALTLDEGYHKGQELRRRLDEALGARRK
jgi:hypothetical protein